MGKVFLSKGILIDELDGDFNCPICTCPNSYEDYGAKFEKSKLPICNIKCKGCKRKLTITFDISGDVVVWEPESAIRKIYNDILHESTIHKA